MSKKGGLNTSNTLFNYFSKSPATPSSKKKEIKDDEATPAKKIKCESPVAAVKRVAEERSSEKEVNGNDSEEEKIISSKKRRRIVVQSESDSDTENDSDTLNVKNDKNDDKRESKDSRFDKFKAPKGEKVNENGDVSSASIKKEQASPSENSSKLNLESKIKKEKKSPSKSENVYNEDDAVKYEGLDEPVVWPHNKLEFLKPEKIKDKAGRRPDHPDYDPKTLYVPESFLNSLTPAVRQWWVFKSTHFDCILFFKVGKFYEMYHMDADIGVKELGFTYMRGEFAHSGFPEVSFDKMASTLVQRGYKVARVEQTETPDMMTERVKKMKGATKFDKVVRREICQITNKGTQVYNGQCQVTYNHQPNYLLVVVEKNLGSNSEYGVCYIDTSIGDFYIGQFEDDKNCSRFLTLVSHNSPALIIHEKTGVSPRTMQIYKTILGTSIKEWQNDNQFWDGEKTLKYLAENFFRKSEESKPEWPDAIKLMQDDGDHLGLTPKKGFELALKSLGGCISYLKRMLIDEQVIAMARYSQYIPPDEHNIKTEKMETEEVERPKREMRNKCMVLDYITLSNLRITGEEHSLLKTLDKCCTKFGKRLLHYWLCAPSCDAAEIRGRQEVISELIMNPETLKEMRSLFNTLPDLERYLAQIHGFGNGARLKTHPDGRAILFEEKTYNKKKIQNFISILRGFESLLKVPEMFSEFKSKFVLHLTQKSPEGAYPELSELIKFFKNAFDHDEALKEGVIAPEKGVDADFDAIEEKIEEIAQRSKKYLTEQEKYFNCRISYFGTDKKRYQLEIPESNARKAGVDYVLEGQRKGSKPVRRFHTAETKDILKSMMQAEDERSKILKDLSRRIFEKFSTHYVQWKRCIDSVAVLDVLGALAEYAKEQIDFCVPEIVEESDVPFIELEEGFHPCMTSSSNYIPNGIHLGGHEAPLVLLTGPNMGGKSTLMRQAGLLAVMVQIGALIPAQRCKMTLIDRIFTRLGAQDDIIAGHSTFLVELNETSSILKHATVDSLVLLDELGRGTATYDGTAIAASVVHFLSDLKCRTLFSTHYHTLVDYFQRSSTVALGHMACMVENEDSEDPTQETVTFLYKYANGACPKSYGFNAAKLAGMPREIIKRAYDLSRKVETEAVKRKIISKMLCKVEVKEVRDLLAKVSLGKAK